MHDVTLESVAAVTDHFKRIYDVVALKCDADAILFDKSNVRKGIINV